MLTADSVTIANVRLTLQSARLVEFCGVDVRADVERVRAEGNCDGLLIDCLEGCEDASDAEGWRDYVSAVCAAAEAEEPAPWTSADYWSTVVGRSAAQVVREYELTSDRAQVAEWLDRAQIAAWEAGATGGRMPAEWGAYFDRALDELVEAAQDAAEVAS